MSYKYISLYIVLFIYIPKNIRPIISYHHMNIYQYKTQTSPARISRSAAAARTSEPCAGAILIYMSHKYISLYIVLFIYIPKNIRPIISYHHMNIYQYKTQTSPACSSRSAAAARTSEPCAGVILIYMSYKYIILYIVLFIYIPKNTRPIISYHHMNIYHYKPRTSPARSSRSAAATRTSEPCAGAILI